MGVRGFFILMVAFVLPAAAMGVRGARGQSGPVPPDLDVRVQAFLDGARDQWRDWNVPYEDGRILHDLVVANGFRRILEIGTSTGHSTIWLAWAAAKTGGKVITIEMDPGRRGRALENLRKAGLDAFVDARLADAHGLVRALPGPFDFVFCDADKEWYPRYFQDLDPKIAAQGCFTAHNVLRNVAPGVQEFLRRLRERPDYRTRIETGSGEGISVSCKTTP